MKLKWKIYTGKGTAEELKSRVGLGDLVASVAKPVARTIDFITKDTALQTNLASCKTCEDRRRVMNEFLGFHAKQQ